MGIGDALVIAGAGVARGYRGSQELQRQLAELKIRQLLEQQRTDIMNKQADSEIALNALRGQTEGAQREHYLGEEKRASEANTAGSMPLAPGSRGAALLGQIGLPNQARYSGSVSPLIEGEQKYGFMKAHPDFFERFKPPVSGEDADIRDALKLTLDALGQPSELEMMKDPEKALTTRYNFALKNLPITLARIKELRKGAGSDSTNKKVKDPLGIR